MTDKTNATEHVGTALRGRLDDLADLRCVADSGASAVDNADRLEELGIEAQLSDTASQEEAYQRLAEHPLCVESVVLHEIVLGTGSPDDRLIVEVDQGEIRRILYRYSWSGSAERVLSGEDYETAKWFARLVVPGLEGAI